MREQMLDLETRIFREKSRLEAELERLTSTLEKEIRPRSELLPGLLEERETLNAEAAGLESLAGRVEDARQRMSSIDERVIVLEGDNDRLRETMKDTRQKFDLLESGDLECPLCGQELDSDGREHLRAEYEEIGMRSKTEFQKNENEISALAREREPLARSISQMDSELPVRVAAASNQAGTAKRENRGSGVREKQIQEPGIRDRQPQEDPRGRDILAGGAQDSEPDERVA